MQRVLAERGRHRLRGLGLELDRQAEPYFSTRARSPGLALLEARCRRRSPRRSGCRRRGLRHGCGDHLAVEHDGHAARRALGVLTTLGRREALGGHGVPRVEPFGAVLEDRARPSTARSGRRRPRCSMASSPMAKAGPQRGRATASVPASGSTTWFVGRVVGPRGDLAGDRRRQRRRRRAGSRRGRGGRPPSVGRVAAVVVASRRRGDRGAGRSHRARSWSCSRPPPRPRAASIDVTASTGRNRTLPVCPTSSMARSWSFTPGRFTTTRLPWRMISGSATPRLSMRLRMMSTTTSSESLVGVTPRAAA